MKESNARQRRDTAAYMMSIRNDKNIHLVLANLLFFFSSSRHRLILNAYTDIKYELENNKNPYTQTIILNNLSNNRERVVAKENTSLYQY